MKRLHAVTALAAFLPIMACATPTTGSTASDSLTSQHRLIEAQETARASAWRPGDEQLSCAQLEIEMLAIATDPAYSAAMLANAANAQAITDVTNSSAATIQGVSALSLAGALPVPGMEIVSAVSAHATRAQLQAQQAQTNALMDSTMNNLADMQPGMFRRLRLAELATARNCAFLGGDGVSG